nr:MAG TPA: 30S ribosomal protein S11 [Caudoviricetes sp.]
MKLNFLEFLGVMMIVLIVFIAILCLYYLIKDTINKWKEKYRNECPFCGAYLHGYRNIHMGAKHDARYCSRCGRYNFKRNKINDILDEMIRWDISIKDLETELDRRAEKQ